MKTWAAVATILVLIFLALVLRTVSLPSGGGQIKDSPDGKYVATAQSLQNENPIAPDSKSVYYEFAISEGRRASPFKRVIIYPSGTNDSMYFRELTEIIAWSTNSQDVTFSVPGVFIRMDVGRFE